MGKKTRICPICGMKFTEIYKHYEKYHKDEIPILLFLAKMNGLEEIPKCPVCGKELEYDWSKQHFFKSCKNSECRTELRRINRKEQWTRPGFKERLSDIFKGYWSNEENRIVQSAKLTEVYRDPEVRKRVSDGVKRAYDENPDFLKSVRRASKEHWQNPEYALKVKMGMSESLMDKDLYVYLYGFKDSKTGNYCVKCGVSTDSARRLTEYKLMDYEFIKGYQVVDKYFNSLELEYRVHANGFEKYYMDLRSIGKMSNGYTEWYQPTELYKIKSFIESQGYTLTEIKL